jgi:hypothetical protein
MKAGDIFIVEVGDNVSYLYDFDEGISCADVEAEHFLGSVFNHVSEKNFLGLLIENMNLKIDDYLPERAQQKHDKKLMNKDVWKVLVGEYMFLMGFDDEDWSKSNK